MTEMIEIPFWPENCKVLFSSTQLVPLRGMCMEEKLNSLTRLTGILFVVMLLLDFPYAIPFFIVSLVFIIIAYYIQKNSDESIVPFHNTSLGDSSFNSTWKKPFQGMTPLDIKWMAEPVRSGNGLSYVIKNEPPNFFCNDYSNIGVNDSTFISA